ncbi:hypothetical protein NDU88_001663 [Pleurodeles waltl]|uniref:Uncharacterized protein n=1 Tax=Pleurodeles waltl TaxID=8319 RepID=A0AAV7U8K4_PLEWA|nr:hypothetical protein NDU88_001663 [Pleurodeles waltl]
MLFWGKHLKYPGAIPLPQPQTRTVAATLPCNAHFLFLISSYEAPTLTPARVKYLAIGRMFPIWADKEKGGRARDTKRLVSRCTAKDSWRHEAAY